MSMIEKFKKRTRIEMVCFTKKKVFWIHEFMNLINLQLEL